MRRVIIESPFAGNVERNKDYLKRCVRDSLGRGESPYASHGFFTQFLNDDVPIDRKLGINAGLAWADAADEVIYYMDLGMSNGMRFALRKHAQQKRKINVRTIWGGNVLKFYYVNQRFGPDHKEDVLGENPRFYWGRYAGKSKERLLLEVYSIRDGYDRTFPVKNLFFDTTPFADQHYRQNRR